MSVIEDTRKIAQDFLAPELRAISVRLDALEKKVDENERRAEKRHGEVLTAIDRITDYNAIRERVSRLESKDGSHQ